MARIEIGADVEIELAEEDDDPFDRMAFAVAALDLVRPPQTRVAVCEGASRVRVESGRLWGRGEGARWAMLSIPARASRRAIALAITELTRGTSAPWALDVLLAQKRPVPRMTNYITRAGAKKLQDEVVRLRSDRPKVVQDVADAAAQGDRSENAEYIYGKKKLREIDRRIHFSTKRLEAAQVVEPRTDGETRVFFGATVDVEDEDGKRATYRIVGEDEIDLGRGDVSWRSPLGRVLLKKEEGDTVVLQRPNGAMELTIMAVRYE